MRYRPATAADLDQVAPLIVPDPASPLTADGYRRRLDTGEYRPEWTWVAEASGDVRAAAVWWGRADDTRPDVLDGLLAAPGLPRDQRPEVAGGLLARAHATFRGGDSRSDPAYHMFLPSDWRSRRDVTAALSWRWQAALAAGLTEELERLRFVWYPGHGIPDPQPREPQPGQLQPGQPQSGQPKPGRLVFRREPDDGVFADLFRRVLTGTLDATTRNTAAAVGTAASARADVVFYRDRMRGDRGWWLVASTPDGAPVGFGVPSRNSDVAVVGYIGVLPEHRGRGYIDEILAETTRVLVAEAGAGVIHADTDLANRPMAAAFERAGYVNTSRRVVLSAPIMPG
jgi:RimJ/RimL family protein N-acetyltransferase